MGKDLAKVMQAKQDAKAREKGDKGEDKPLPPVEQRALKNLQREAEKAGATLASEGKGGLPPSMVLGAMRRDKFKCKRCGGQENLSVHHKAHLENPSPAMKMLGKNVDQRTDPRAIATICEACHDKIHDADREDVEGNE
jgi:hypothetical protein